MTECVIFAGGELKNLQLVWDRTDKNSFVICADSGYKYARQLGITPKLTVGDFDSLGYVPESMGEIMTFPKEKDDSDLMLAIREALSRGFKRITILGALGGRFDHTYSNVQSLGFIASNGAQGRIISESEEITLLSPGEYSFPKNPSCSLSLFSYSERVSGLTLKGVKYPLENGEITNLFPIGISNVITAEKAVISFTDGQLLVICSQL